MLIRMGDDDNPAKVPPLILDNEAEQIEWENGKKRKELRMMRKKRGIL